MEKHKDKQFLEKKYVKEDNSQDDIAKELGISRGSIQYQLRKHGIEKGSKCPDCGNKFIQLQTHLRQSKCELAPLDRRQEQIIEGLVMGDAWIHKPQQGNCLLAIESAEEEFIEWVYNELQPYSQQKDIRSDAEGRRKRLENNPLIDYHPGIKNIYHYYTRRNEFFTELRDTWYGQGQKEFPKELDLTPMKLKIWYVCDGSLTDSIPSITATNEEERIHRLLDKFEEIGIEARKYRDKIIVEDSDRFFSYIGDPIPGYEYKWI